MGSNDTSSNGPLAFPLYLRLFVEGYLPAERQGPDPDPGALPHVTLAYASSLDGCIALTPGAPTAISGPLTKAMTHYLRSAHSAVLVGVGTAIADDPVLNTRLKDAGAQPRPVVVDPHGRWAVNASSRMVRTAHAGQGQGVWVLHSSAAGPYPDAQRAVVEGCGGKVIDVAAAMRPGDEAGRLSMDWRDVLVALKKEGIVSVMVEGGATVINALLSPECQPLVTSVVLTIAPIFLGRGGVNVCPERRTDRDGVAIPAATLMHVAYQNLQGDTVMCARVKKESG
ncbi:MAG: 2,5-diamino-6-(ribosylamino)-4(3H)-pyrimidinone 5'-phosphate reductase [Phylliscum demangeonii]|nr:MAG: 2,5-diamino-6-(ribosylamino)-4(3H)-pyrimidinone 5'-phosphate reductase [Phylliscum demangeonii]